MTVLVGLALISALCTGYHLGRRTGSRPPPWRKRTSRLALGRLTASLVVLVVARRVQRMLIAQRRIPAASGLWGHLPAAQLLLPRGRPARRPLRRR
nr:hypothetical protein [Mycobacterium gordonae]